jgi:uncharacterized protein YheU (UPF0270 family)
MKPVQLPLTTISRQALAGLVEEFVTREGTDYGVAECTLEKKTRDVMRQLEHGEAVIVFDPESETFNIVPGEALRLPRRS